MRLKGEHIWIIGASFGIGAALAERLAREGATIAISARSIDGLREVAGKLAGDDHRIVMLDVADAGAIDGAVAELLASWPKIDRIVFCAGTYAPGNIEMMEIESINRVIDVNLRGAIFLARAIAAPLFKQGYGQVLWVSSVAGYRGLPNGQPYSSTKAALINFAESMRAEWHQKGIDVRVVNPGFVQTRMTAKNRFPMPMIISPEKAADYILRGMLRKGFVIGFPPAFHVVMRLIAALPYGIYFWLTKRMITSKDTGS